MRRVTVSLGTPLSTDRDGVVRQERTQTASDQEAVRSPSDGRTDGFAAEPDIFANVRWRNTRRCRAWKRKTYDCSSSTHHHARRRISPLPTAGCLRPPRLFIDHHRARVHKLASYTPMNNQSILPSPPPRSSHAGPSEAVRTVESTCPQITVPSFLTESPTSISSPMGFPTKFPDASPTRSMSPNSGRLC